VNVEMPMPELHRVARPAPLLLLTAQALVVEGLQRLGGGLLVVAGVVGQAHDGGEGELLVGDPVLLRSSIGSMPSSTGELVHHPLDAERGLRTPGAAVGVGERLRGEHVGAGELQRRDPVDGVEHERAQDRHARADEAEVGPHVGEQVHVQAR
jgi:hypothetical protein